MSFGKCAFGQSWRTGGDKSMCMSVRKSDLSPYPTVHISQYGDPLKKYAGDKKSHVTKIICLYGLFRFCNGMF